MIFSTFELPVQNLPNEPVPVHFLGFFTSWIRLREVFLYADPDPQHCLILVRYRLLLVTTGT